MKNQALFSSKDKSEKLKCRLLQFLFGALRVKLHITPNCHLDHVYQTFTHTVNPQYLKIYPKLFTSQSKFSAPRKLLWDIHCLK